jgi:hypothetical protein
MPIPDTHAEAHIRFNPNRIVALNLKRARLLRGMTHAQAAAALEPYLGTSWAKTTFSMAERSAHKQSRVRRFDAAELAAFAQAFDLPVAWFLMPPRVLRTPLGGDEPNFEIPPDVPGEPGVEVVDLVDSILKTDRELDERIAYAIDDGRQGYHGLADELERRKGAAERRQQDLERARSLTSRSSRTVSE